MAKAAGASALTRKLIQFDPLGEEELAALAKIEGRRRRVAAGAELLFEHQADHRAFVVQEGWACSYKLLPDGKRQVIDIVLPGDFLGLHGIFLRMSDHAASAVTDLVVAEVRTAQLIDIFQRLPRLGVAILWAASRHQSIVIEHLVGVGRRAALSRTAHFMIELGLRLQFVGMGSATGFTCPLNQYILADALGLTAIHLNRILRHLRELRLMTFREGRVTFHDFAGLRKLAGYDGGYLDQDDAPN